MEVLFSAIGTSASFPFHSSGYPQDPQGAGTGVLLTQLQHRALRTPPERCQGHINQDVPQILASMQHPLPWVTLAAFALPLLHCLLTADPSAQQQEMTGRHKEPFNYTIMNVFGLFILPRLTSAFSITQREAVISLRSGCLPGQWPHPKGHKQKQRNRVEAADQDQSLRDITRAGVAAGRRQAQGHAALLPIA